MRLLMTFDLTMRGVGRVLLLLLRLAAVVAVVYFLAGPAVSLLLGVVLAWTLWAVATLGRDR